MLSKIPCGAMMHVNVTLGKCHHLLDLWCQVNWAKCNSNESNNIQNNSYYSIKAEFISFLKSHVVKCYCSLTGQYPPAIHLINCLYSGMIFPNLRGVYNFRDSFPSQLWVLGVLGEKGLEEHFPGHGLPLNSCEAPFCPTPNSYFFQDQVLH